MTIQAALYERLSGYTGLAALAGLRVYPTAAPQNAAVPYVVFTLISSQRFSAMGSDIGIVRARFQVDAFAADFTAAKNASVQARAALQRYSGTASDGTEVLDVFVEDESDTFGYETLLYQSTFDIDILYRE